MQTETVETILTAILADPVMTRAILVAAILEMVVVILLIRVAAIRAIRAIRAGRAIRARLEALAKDRATPATTRMWAGRAKTPDAVATLRAVARAV